MKSFVQSTIPVRLWLLCLCSLLLFAFAPARAQNVIEDRSTSPTAAPVRITEAQVLEIVNRAPSIRLPADGPESKRVQAKLNRHVREFLDGWPWLPFHNTLGISGYESYFQHPDEVFYALSLALPGLPENTAAEARRFLVRELTHLPPYVIEGYAPDVGQPRESYSVPVQLRTKARPGARHAFGVYSFWLFVHVTGDAAAARSHWPKVVERIQPLLARDYPFDPARRNYVRDEAELLNADLAALIATVRLARTNADLSLETRALQRTRELLELRVNLERVNPKILEATQSTTKHLHAGKLPRYCALVPEVGEAVRTLTENRGASHLRRFREARPAWHLAFGERTIGGENYINPPHFSRALFAGVVFVERLPRQEIASFIDVPWCRGDLYFIEKCALALGWSP